MTHSRQFNIRGSQIRILRFRDRFEMTPLHVAAMYDNLEAVKLLLANGADPELESSEGGTPITCAEIYGNQEILDCFFKFLGEENPYKASKPLLPMF